MAHQRHDPWVVFLGWFVGNLLAFVLVALVPLIYPAVQPIHGGMIVSSVIIGLPIGLAQWIALRRVAPVSFLWIFSISVALPLALVILDSPILLGAFSSFGDESIVALMTGYAVVGFVVGLIQWPFLRGHFSQPFLWAPLSSAGLGFGLGLALALISRSGIAPVTLAALVYTIATGAVISWMRISGASHEASLPGAP